MRWFISLPGMVFVLLVLLIAAAIIKAVVSWPSGGNTPVAERAVTPAPAASELNDLIDRHKKTLDAIQARLNTQDTVVKTVKDKTDTHDASIEALKTRLETLANQMMKVEERVNNSQTAGGMTAEEKKVFDQKLKELDQKIEELQKGPGPAAVKELSDKVSQLNNQLVSLEKRTASTEQFNPLVTRVTAVEAKLAQSSAATPPAPPAPDSNPAPAAAKPGDYAKQSTKFFWMEAYCPQIRDEPATLQDELAKKYEAMDRQTLMNRARVCRDQDLRRRELEAQNARAEVPPTQEVAYRGNVRANASVYVPADEEAALRRRARNLLGERGIEGAYHHETLDSPGAPGPGCVKFGAPVPDPRAGFMHQRWHCPRS